MFLNLFSKYLISQNKLTDEQFNLVKEAQLKTRVKLGLIAVSEKIISEKQADEINRKQAVMDKRFGDIAVELGYLTPDQVSKLLELQGNPYMLFCQAVTDNNILTLSEIEDLFQKYITDNNFDDDAKDAIKSDDIDRIIPLFVKNIDDSMLELVSVSIRTMNRLISTDLYINEGKILNSYKYDYCSSQAIEGDVNISLGISGDKSGVLEIAGLFAGEEFSEVDLDSLDSIGEFINIVNGLYATALSYRKVQVELIAPNLMSEGGELTEGKILVIPMEVNQKAFDLIINLK